MEKAEQPQVLTEALPRDSDHPVSSGCFDYVNIKNESNDLTRHVSRWRSKVRSGPEDNQRDSVGMVF